MYKKIDDLNRLKRNGIKGIYKHWIYKSAIDYNLVANYLQKISFSIGDINKELENNNLGRKEIVFIIVVVNWIKESYNGVLSKIKEKIKEQFVSYYNNNEKLNKATKYFNAIRSYSVAHPMTTTRHKEYGFDGSFICVDLEIKGAFSLAFNLSFFDKNTKFYYLDYDGLHKDRNDSHKYFLTSYSEDYDRYEFFKYISFSLEDILDVARIYIDLLLKLDLFLSKIKRKDYK
ncbi:MAG: hypothetical protein HUJ42_03560 [Malacoplasma sp.]|nr:hypothetical protein [Malacoplasma sp.]